MAQQDCVASRETIARGMRALSLQGCIYGVSHNLLRNSANRPTAN